MADGQNSFYKDLWVRKGSILCEINRTQIQLCIRQHIDAFLPKWVPFPAHNEPWAPKFSPSFSQKKKKLENYQFLKRAPENKLHNAPNYLIKAKEERRSSFQLLPLEKVEMSDWQKSWGIGFNKLWGGNGRVWYFAQNCNFLIRFRQTIQGKFTWIEKWFLDLVASLATSHQTT